MQLSVLTSTLFVLGSVVANSKVLDGKNFESTIKEGNWFVKFYSPYCGYSKRMLKPFADAAVDSTSLEKEDFHFGEVDCIANSKLCDKNKIDGYPTLFMFKKGENKEEYTGPADKSKIITYVNEKAKEYKL